MFSFLWVLYTHSPYKILHPIEENGIYTIFEKIGWNLYAKEHSEFYAFQKKLNALGFTSLDLT